MQLNETIDNDEAFDFDKACDKDTIIDPDFDANANLWVIEHDERDESYGTY